jgi:hypothetical protein
MAKTLSPDMGLLQKVATPCLSAWHPLSAVPQARCMQYLGVVYPKLYPQWDVHEFLAGAEVDGGSLACLPASLAVPWQGAFHAFNTAFNNQATASLPRPPCSGAGGGHLSLPGCGL